jgi:RNA polymerase sigma factor (sigma-70 family)
MKHLAALLRTALAADPAADAALLDRFRTGRDAEAFAELVRRHGRLVWAACRHQTRTEADADDCFQAVWLALARNPKAVRDPAKLSAFLHAVAVRVCRKLRAADDRRTARERAAASPDGRAAVPDSAWDRALAAVHEEVAGLPEPLRVAFVRCCLEGQGVTEAAAALGWKLGTLSGRLTRAKDQLTRRLDARGLTAGAVAAVACGGTVPAAVAGRAVELAVGGTVPAAVLTLFNGVTVMNRVKLLAAGLLVAGGLGAGVGGGWGPTVGAQAPPAKLAADAKPASPARNVTSRWEYRYLPAKVIFHVKDNIPAVPQIARTVLQEEIEKMEADGWTLLAVVPMESSWQGDGKLSIDRDQVSPVLMFRRPVQRAYQVELSDGQRLFVEGGVGPPQPSRTPVDAAARGPVPPVPIAATAPRPDGAPAERTTTLTPAAYTKRIRELEAELAALKGQSQPPLKAVFDQPGLPLDLKKLEALLATLARDKFGDSKLQITVVPGAAGAIYLEGDDTAVRWAQATIRAMAGAVKGAK